MKIAIVHLSDIHLKSANDPIMNRIDKISAVINQYSSYVEQVFLLFTGDIAFSGTQEQYLVAETLINQLRNNILENYNLKSSVVVVPGNHDCNFQHNTSVREAVLSSIASEPSSIDKSLIDICIGVQREYFDFRKRIASEGLSIEDELWSQYSFKLENKIVVFDCINVSWASLLHEKQGRLLFPYELYSENRNQESDLRVALLHHPMHWLMQDHYRTMRAKTRSFGDLILTGHEHNESAYEINDSSVGESFLIEADALQLSNDSNKSKFNIVEIDLEEGLHKYDVYSLENGDYDSVEHDSGWETYRSLPKRKKNELEISNGACKWLRDAGANYIHPSKANIELSDIYIHPDLENMDEDIKADENIVNSKILTDKKVVKDGVLVIGQEKSGKTALLKNLFLDYYENSYIPIYVDLKIVSKAAEKDFLSVLKSLANQQYNDDKGNRWLKLPKNRKILLLDDLDRSGVADRYRWKILEYAKKHADIVIVTAGEMFEIDEVTSRDMTDQLGIYGHYEIQSFGHELRYKLIRKWRSIGNEYTLSSDQLLAKVDAAEKIINTVLGNNLVPRVPIYLLTILQSQETANPTDIRNSAFGHYYQYLITGSLTKNKISPGELDENFNYLSQMAWLFFSSKRKEYELSELEQFNKIYSEEYSRVDCKDRLSLLVKARLLDRRGDYFSFSYPYVFYYFLGKYIADNIHQRDEIQLIIKKCAKHVYTRENANVLLFTIHHQKSDYVIGPLLENIENLFSEFEAIDLEKDTSAFNQLIEGTAHLIYQDRDPEQNRIEARKKQDKHESKRNKRELKEVEEGKELDLVSKLHKLFKAVEIMGQLLKSYYGSIRNDSKKKIINEIYEGPLRALRGFFNELENNRENLIKDVEEYLKSKDTKLKKDERETLARKFIFNYLGIITFGMIYKSASATSSKHLLEVTKDYVEEKPSLAHRLIALAAKLDMPGSLPYEEIDRLSKDTEKNILSHRLLETIILRHLYYFRVSEKDKQRICNILKIPMNKQRSIEIKSKQRKLH